MTAVPPRITNPQAVPVVGVDDHLPPVPLALLTAQALRQRFHGGAPQFVADSHGDGVRLADPGRPPAAAAVLVPLVLRAHGVQVLLTRRTEHLRSHAGQISFPGGRSEPYDADAVATALRETQEEVGILPAEVEILGQLPRYSTITRFDVTPVVALLQPNYTLRPDPFEVAEAFEVPLAYLMTPAHHRRHALQVDGQNRFFLSMPWQAPGAAAVAGVAGLSGLPAGPGANPEYFIWGATAAMLRNLYRCLAHVG